MPSDWNDNHAISLFKGKCSGKDYENYRDLKLINHVLKIIIVCVSKKCVREMVKFEKIRLAFRPGVGTNDAILLSKKLPEKYQAKYKKPFDKWIVALVQAMYKNPKSKFRADNDCSLGVSAGSIVFHYCFGNSDIDSGPVAAFISRPSGVLLLMCI